ncbi:hypothetical protein OAT18_03095 [Tenacibaculum sp.]|nr:hypothetical protein [Tenacibaculum sp.]
MKIKYNLILIFLLSALKINAQSNSEYGILIQTVKQGSSVKKHHPIYVKNGVNTILTRNLFSGGGGKSFFDYGMVKKDFGGLTFYADDFGILTANDPQNLCLRNSMGEWKINKNDFETATKPREFKDCDLTHKVYLLHTRGPSALEPLCTRNTIKLSGGYDWQYAIGDISANTVQWKHLASAKVSIEANIGEIYVNENIRINDLPIGDFKRSIHFRTGYNGSGKYVNSLSYRVIGCSPKFNNYYEKLKTSCSYKNDGRVSLSFERNLDTNERLIVTIYNSDGVLLGQETKEETLINLGVDNFGYVWPNLLGQDTYYFLYQTQNKNFTIPIPQENDDGSSWDKLVRTPIFTIEKSLAVNFNIEKINDKTCFKKEDGIIKIMNISGELGRNFSYIMTKPDGTSQEVNINGNSAVISGLGSGKYKIKVKDSRGCYAK